MGRTVLEIYDEMVSVKQTMSELTALEPNIDSSQDLLNDLTTTSKVGVWRIMFFVFSYAIWTVESLFDLHKIWINQRALEIQTGTLPWYQRLALDFQYGDPLVFINGVYRYETINEANKIVKLATTTEVGGQIILKVAKLDGSGDPEPLTTPELTALQDYIKEMKFAGAKILTVSRSADLMKVHYLIYYNPLVLSSTGELISSPGTFPVRDAINNYGKGLPFNGRYSITEQTDMIQLATGVVNPIHQSTEVKYGSNPYTTFSAYYQPNAGYLRVDPAYPLSTTITYIAAT